MRVPAARGSLRALRVVGSASQRVTCEALRSTSRSPPIQCEHAMMGVQSETTARTNGESVHSAEERGTGVHVGAPPATYRVAAVQVAPAFLNLLQCLKIAEYWIAEAGRQDISLVVFPETWLPGYPVWLDNAPGVSLWNSKDAKVVFRRLFENSLLIEGGSPELTRLCNAARKASVMVVMGVNEREGGTLYNSIIYISASGELLGKHRKLVPTHTERTVWGRGDGSTLPVVDSPLGKVGGLVCWEHWMPLARQAMHERGEVIHAAVWPSVFDTHQVASRSYAFEVGSVLKREHLPTDIKCLNEMPGSQWMFGKSAIIGPNGKYIKGPVGDEEGLVVAEIEPGVVIEELMTLDVCGHYSRPDVFNFSVNDGGDREQALVAADEEQVPSRKHVRRGKRSGPKRKAQPPPPPEGE